MNDQATSSPSKLAIVSKDLVAGTVVFLVALPLCLGIALASGAPLISGIITGIVGGILVGVLSGSHSSVSGPAAGLTAVVAAQIAGLGSFEAFLLAVVVGGVFQIVLGFLKAGGLNAFFPSSVFKGLLAAIGVILILKQFPHLLGRDTDPEGDLSFQQPDQETTFSELARMIESIHEGALVIGVVSIVVLILWDRIKFLKKSSVPAPLIVVALGVGMGMLFGRMGEAWTIGADHMVQVPVAESVSGFFDFLRSPDFSRILDPAIYVAGLTIAIVASLETLLNLEAVDRIDPLRRHSPPNRELIAQGIGNVTAGMLGGLPMTSVIIRSSVNINVGARTRISAIFHGVLLVVCVVFFPMFLNKIPLSCLAAILLMTGFKLASPKLFAQMWKSGRYQFIPFVATVSVIVLTDLLIGILVGLAVSVTFILFHNLRRPMRRVVEKHVAGEVVHIELPNQVSFLNRAVLERTLRATPEGGQVLLDARGTNYMDPDVMAMIEDFKDNVGPSRGIKTSLRGFDNISKLRDEIQFVDYTTRELQEQISPDQALKFLVEGNERFRTDNRLTRDLGRQIRATQHGQHPIAVVLSCIDSRTPAEIILDLGLGDIFSVRVAGNVVSNKILGSIEYGCAVAGAKLVVVLGHTRCGAVTAAVNQAVESASMDLVSSPASSGLASSAPRLEHVESILGDISTSVDASACRSAKEQSKHALSDYVDDVARRNVEQSMRQILDESSTIRELARGGKVAVVGGMYDIATGEIKFFTHNGLRDDGVQHLVHAAE